MSLSIYVYLPLFIARYLQLFKMFGCPFMFTRETNFNSFAFLFNISRFSSKLGVEFLLVFFGGGRGNSKRKEYALSENK